MKRITEVELHNLLAFYGTANKITLKNGENLLLYGENGSGKSSFCRALELFFDARNQPNFAAKHRNIWASPTDAATNVRVQFLYENYTPPFLDVEMPNKIIPNWIEESRLASGFLTYRDMLKTHFVEEYRANLFDLVVEDILRGYKNPASGKTGLGLK